MQDELSVKEAKVEDLGQLVTDICINVSAWVRWEIIKFAHLLRGGKVKAAAVGPISEGRWGGSERERKDRRKRKCGLCILSREDEKAAKLWP
jgi:hypothetical protein